MVEDYYYGGIIRGTAAERAAYTATNLPQYTLWLEKDTDKIYDWDGALWRQKGGGLGPNVELGDDYTWKIYKAGSNYKARNGFLQTALKTDTSLDTVWTWLSDNFDQTGVPDVGTGGSVVFDKGVFTFNALPAPWASVDETWAGQNGIHIRGQGMLATALKFAPSTPVTDAIDWKNMSHGSLSNMWIDINNNITNAIKINALTTSCANNTFEKLYITNTSNGGLSLAGQRGIYLLNGGANNALFFNTFDTIYTRNINHVFDTTGCTVINNTSYLLRNFRMWLAEFGITLHGGTQGRALQTQISNIWHQCSTDIGLYTVMIQDANPLDSATRARYHIVDGVIADGNTKAGNYVIIVGRGASHCKVANVNASGNADRLLLDRSGNITNEFSNCGNNIASRHQGALDIASALPAITGTGLFAGNFTHEIVGTGSAVNTNFAAANGRTLTLSTGTTTASKSAIRSTTWVSARQFAPKLFVRFHMSFLTSQRWFLGLTEHNAVAPSNDAYVSGEAVIAICQRSNDLAANGFQLMYNDTDGAPNFTPFLNSDGQIIPIDTLIHILWLYTDAIENKLWISLDGNTPMELDAAIAGGIPNTNAQLKFFASIENTTAANRSLNLYKVNIESAQ